MWGWVVLAVLAELGVNVWSNIQIWQLDELCWLVAINLKSTGLFIIFRVSRVSSVSRVRSQHLKLYTNLAELDKLCWLVAIKLKNKGLFIISRVSRVSSVSRVRSQVSEQHRDTA